MQTKADAQLLREYAEHGAEDAFGEIVARHADLVYSAALRQVASPDVARDVAQSVFTDLARKAPALARQMQESGMLVGWLYRGTRYAALTWLRNERRRLARERQVMEELTPASESTPDWDRIRPVLDEAMAGLSDEDRDALLLRFFKNQDFRDVGSALGVSDDAAQKRVTRALGKLHSYLVNRGVTTTAAALSTSLLANAVQVAPLGLAAILANASLAGAAMGGGGTLAFLKFMSMAKIKVGLVGAVALTGIAVPLVKQHQTAVQLRREIESLHQQAQHWETVAAENERLSNTLSNTVVRANNTRLLDNEQFNELMRLRGEIATSRTAPKQLEVAPQARQEQPPLGMISLEEARLPGTTLPTPAVSECRKNLRQIEGAIAQWALENKIIHGSAVQIEKVLPYLENGKLPQCPSGGTYTHDWTDIAPLCSIQGHSY